MAQKFRPWSLEDIFALDDPRKPTDRLSQLRAYDRIGSIPVPAQTLSEPRGMEAKPRMRYLLLDIENSPNLAYVYEMWKTNVYPEKLVTPSDILCFAAGWLDESEIHFHSQWQDGKDGMLRAVHGYLDEADAVITYYGDDHDLPIIKRELLISGYKPPSPYKSIDLYKSVKRQFNFTHNGLDQVAQRLGLPGKTDKLPFKAWIQVMERESSALARVEEYNKGDVEALRGLYNRLQPWINNHPSHAAFSESHICPACGSDNLERRGYAYTAVSKFQRYQCRNCGKWSRNTTRDSGVKIREVAGY